MVVCVEIVIGVARTLKGCEVCCVQLHLCNREATIHLYFSVSEARTVRFLHQQRVSPAGEQNLCLWRV